jgi:hypothetical protein
MFSLGRRWRDGEVHRRLRALRAPWRPAPEAQAEGASGALVAAEGWRAADGLAAHGAVEGEDAVEQRCAAGAGAAEVDMAFWSLDNDE